MSDRNTRKPEYLRVYTAACFSFYLGHLYADVFNNPILLSAKSLLSRAYLKCLEKTCDLSAA